MAVQTTAVQTRVRSEIRVKTWTKATLYVVNEVFRIWSIILAQRGLSNKKINESREVLYNGLSTWLATHHLESASVEMYHEGSQEAPVVRPRGQRLAPERCPAGTDPRG